MEEKEEKDLKKLTSYANVIVFYTYLSYVIMMYAIFQN
jgi:hypothetical protein